MHRVVRLVTRVDVREEGGVEGASESVPADARGWTAAPRGAGGELDPRRISVSARHEAVLEDGNRLLLLDDRGWTEELRGAAADGIEDLWAVTPERDIVETARAVVGPDEPFGGRTQNDMETDHWNALAQILRAQGVAVDAGELMQLPHEVELSDRLRARLGQRPGGATGRAIKST
jgi:hypothetical protein